MSKIIISVCLVLFLASVSYGDEWEWNKIITSWENPTNADDPVAMNSWGATFVPGQTVGVTDGSYSCGVTGPIGWHQLNMMNLNADDITTHDWIYVDVTALAADWVGDSGFNFGMVLNSAWGWQQQYNTGIWWSALSGKDLHETITFDLDYYKCMPTNWAQVGFEIDSYSNDGLQANYVIYLDNLRICAAPEPATMALMGLGGLALIRRKK